jgi:hypothetical protein
MCRASRFVKTAATSGRSWGTAVSFSTRDAEFGCHHAAEIFCGGLGGKAIGGRKQIAFERGRGWIKIVNAGCVFGGSEEVVGRDGFRLIEYRGDIETVTAFGNSDLFVIDLTQAYLFENLEESWSAAEVILASLEFRPRMQSAQNEKSPR